MSTFLAIAAALDLLVAFGLFVYKEGRRKGYRDGFDAGRKSADNWWIEVERGIDREREKIWKEEL